MGENDPNLPTLPAKSTVKNNVHNAQANSGFGPPSNQQQCNPTQCKTVADQMRQMNSSSMSVLAAVAGKTNLDFNKIIAAMKEYNQSPEIAEGIKRNEIEDAYNSSYNKLNNAQSVYEQNLNAYCASNSGATICTKDRNQKIVEATEKLDNFIKQGQDLSNNIAILINTYQSDKLATNRMDELIRERKDEYSIEKKMVDNFIKEVQTNQRQSFYDEQQHTFYDEIKILLIFIFYEVLLIYFFSSNFFSDQRWKKYAYIIILILYLSFPFYLPYLVIIVFNIYNSILKYFGLYKNNITANSLANSGLPVITND